MGGEQVARMAPGRVDDKLNGSAMAATCNNWQNATKMRVFSVPCALRMQQADVQCRRVRPPQNVRPA